MALRVLRQFSLRAVITTLTVIALSLSGVVAQPTSSKANFQNSTTPSTSVAPTSDFDYAAEFDGYSYMKSDTTAAVIPTSGNYTVEAWVNPRAHAGTDAYRAIVAQDQNDAGTNAGRFLLALHWDGSGYQIHVGLNNQAGVNFKPGVGVPVNAWSHIAVVMGTSSLAVYFNGQKIGTANTRFNPTNTLGFTVGGTAGATPTHYFTGQLDQVKIWNQNIDDSQKLTTSMHSWQGITGQTLRAHYDFNERTAAHGRIFDRLSTTGYHLLINGAVKYPDIKTYRELNGKLIFTFPRSYLTANGGWKTPVGSTSINALVVGGGGAGGWAEDIFAGGGGGGQVIERNAQSITSAAVLQVQVGQGGVSISVATNPGSPTNGGSSVLKPVSGTAIAEAVGGGSGFSGGFEVTDIPAGGTSPFLGGTVNKGGSGAGPTAAGVAATGYSGADGYLPLASEFAYSYFGGGGGSGPTGSGGKGGGAPGSGPVTASSGTPNTGGGGGGAAQAAGDADLDLGGNGGSGIIIVSVDQLAKCGYMAGKYNLSPYGGPNIVFGPLTGGGNPGNIVIHRDGSATASTASFHGEPALVNGKLYVPDLGNAKLKILPYDMASPRTLVGTLPSPGLGATADERYVYTWNSTGVSRYDTIDGTFIQTFVPKGDMLKSAGEMAFVRYKGKGYLFLVNGDVNKSGTNYSRVYFVQVSGEGFNPASPIPALSVADNLFSESKLANGVVSTLPSSGIAVVGDNLYWTTYGATSNPNGAIYRKSLTDFDTGVDGKPVDTNADEILLSRQAKLRSLAADSANLYFDADGGSSGSSVMKLNLATKKVTEANGPGPGAAVANGTAPVASCAIAPYGVVRTKAADGSFGLSFASPFPNDTQGISYQVEYRSNGGNWVTQTSFGGSKSLTAIKLPTSVQGYVEFRVATRVSLGNEIQVSEYSLSSPILVGNPPLPPLCENPTKLVYQILAGDKVTINLTSYQEEAVEIDWGNGVRSPAFSWQGNSPFSLTYRTSGTFTVSICGKFSGMGENGTGQQKLIAVTSWGDAEATLTDLSYAFQSAELLTDVPNNLPSGVTNLRSAFERAQRFNDPDIKTWLTPNVTDFSLMFYQARAFNQDIGGWDTSKATTMSQMFHFATAFNNGGSDSIKNWDTSNVTNMSQMFAEAKVFNQPIATDGSKWDVSKVTNFISMFRSAHAFDANISNWVINTAAPVDMTLMFSGAEKFNQNLGPWDVSRVASFSGMFRDAKLFNNGEVVTVRSVRYEPDSIKNWVTSAVLSMDGMFEGASAFNQPLSGWDLSNANSTANMFYNATSFNQLLDWNTRKVTSMAYMFRGASSLKQIPVLEIGVLTDAREMMSFSGLSDDQYGEFMIDLKTKYTASPLVKGVIFGATDKTAACNAPNQAVRDLVAAGWIINDKTDKTTSNLCQTTVTVTASNASHVYGEAVPSIGFSINPSTLPNSDWIKEITCKAIVKNSSTGAFVSNVLASSPVAPAAGTAYVTRCTGPLGSGLGLKITYTDGTYSVAKRPITMAAVDQTVFAGQATSDTPTSVDSSSSRVLLTAGSILQGDLVNLTLDYTTPVTGGAGVVGGAYAASDVGTMTITVALRSGEESNNYSLTALPGLLTVTNKTYIVTAKSGTKEYGQTKSFSSQDWTCVEKVAGTPVTTTACPAGVSISLSSTGASDSALVGEHEIQIGTVQGLNGTIEKVSGTLWVNKKTIVVTPNAKSVVYGADEPTYDFSFLSSEFVNGNGASTISGITCDSAYSKDTPRGTVLPITCSGGESDFYDFTFGTSNLTVLEDSRVARDVPQTIMLAQEESITDVEFSFELSPVNEVCYATFTLYSGEDFLEPVERRVLTGEAAEPIDFNFELEAGTYDYELIAYGNCSIAETTGQLVITEYVAPAPQPTPTEPEPIVPVPYSGPIVNDFSTRQLPLQKPTPVVLDGDRLEMITEIWIGDAKLPFTRDIFGKITLTVPGLPAGVYDLKMVYEGGGTLIHQAAFTVFGSIAGNESTQGGPVSVFGTRTLRYTNFAGDGFRLPQPARVGITRVITSLDDVNRVVCRGITSARSSSAADQKLAENRAKEACNLARQLAPTASIELRTSPAAGVGPRFRAVNLFIVYSLD